MESSGPTTVGGVEVRPPPECPAGWRTGPPDFVGVGAQKSGSSWWFELIAGHPEVANERADKELHYFDGFWDTEFEEQHRLGYHEYFPRPPGGLSGEWTPRYMYDFWVPELLSGCAPDARILVVLRDPVERYLSGVGHEQKLLGMPHPSVAEGSAARGLYHHQLSRVLEHFDREQVLVLQYERLVVDMPGQLERTDQFLGLDAARRSDPQPHLVPRHRPRRADQQLRGGDALAAYYESDLRALQQDFGSDIDLALWPTGPRLGLA
jgi:hypothetical protein